MKNIKTKILIGLSRIWAIQSIRIDTYITLLFVFIYNIPLWRHFFELVNNGTLSIFFTLPFLIALFLISFFFINLLSWRYTHKLWLIFIFSVSPIVLYFEFFYKVQVHSILMNAVFGTNTNEMSSTLSEYRLWLFSIFFGAIPILVVIFYPIKYRRFIRELQTKLKILLITLCLLSIVFLITPRTWAITINKGSAVKFLMIPANFIYFAAEHFIAKITSQIVVKISKNTKRTSLSNNLDKPLLVVFVVGESARSNNFSLNGYNKNTNPLLSKQKDIISFRKVMSCSNETIGAVNCMFSHLPQSKFNILKSRGYENLLDILNYNHFNPVWVALSRTMNVYTRIKSIDLSELDLRDNCIVPGGCTEEDLLTYINPLPNQDNFIVISQAGVGSHASYNTPEKFRKFQPTCPRELGLDKCDKKELFNLYDNTVVYTDYILNKIIETLKTKSKEYNTAFIYISDHGESLGENEIYFHGTMTAEEAPNEQKHIPMILWFSEDFQKNMKINYPCLMKKTDNSLTQDNIFHSMLGLLGISSKLYDKQLDIFNSCRN